MCKIAQFVVSLIVFLVAVWPGVIEGAARWILIAAAVILVVCPWVCDKCGRCSKEETGAPKKKGRRK